MSTTTSRSTRSATSPRRCVRAYLSMCAHGEHSHGWETSDQEQGVAHPAVRFILFVLRARWKRSLSRTRSRSLSSSCRHGRSPLPVDVRSCRQKRPPSRPHARTHPPTHARHRSAPGLGAAVVSRVFCRALPNFKPLVTGLKAQEKAGVADTSDNPFSKDRLGWGRWDISFKRTGKT